MLILFWYSASDVGGWGLEQVLVLMERELANEKRVLEEFTNERRVLPGGCW